MYCSDLVEISASTRSEHDLGLPSVQSYEHVPDCSVEIEVDQTGKTCKDLFESQRATCCCTGRQLISELPEDHCETACGVDEDCVEKECGPNNVEDGEEKGLGEELQGSLVDGFIRLLPHSAASCLYRSNSSIYVWWVDNKSEDNWWTWERSRKGWVRKDSGQTGIAETKVCFGMPKKHSHRSHWVAWA